MISGCCGSHALYGVPAGVCFGNGGSRRVLSQLLSQQDDKMLKELQEEKTKLELELRNLEASIKAARSVTDVCVNV